VSSREERLQCSKGKSGIPTQTREISAEEALRTIFERGGPISILLLPRRTPRKIGRKKKLDKSVGGL